MASKSKPSKNLDRKPTREELSKMKATDMFMDNTDRQILNGALNSIKDRPDVFRKLFKK